MISILLAVGIFYVAKSEEEISSLNEEIRYAEEVDEKRVIELSNMREEIELLNQELDRSADKEKQLQAEKEDLEAKVDELEQEVGSLNRRIKELSKPVVSSTKKNNKPEVDSKPKESRVSETSGETGWKTMTVNASAYTLVENGDKMGGTGLTATGTVPTANRTIAVDPNIIPYGSHIKYNGVTYIAEDTGGIIDGYKVDFFVNTLDEALNFGRKDIDIQVKFP